ncbi:hypothetical protein V8E53_014547, partial [Lactarius tabidus]
MIPTPPSKSQRVTRLLQHDFNHGPFSTPIEGLASVLGITSNYGRGARSFGRLRAVVARNDDVKRHTCTQRSSITASLSYACTNDVELLDGSLERQPPTKFLFGRLMRLELENTLGYHQSLTRRLGKCRKPKPDWWSRDEEESSEMLPDGIGHITSKAMTNLNARLTVLRAAVPNHTALLHFSGQGDRPDVHTARRTASSSLSNTGIGKTLGQSWELAALCTAHWHGQGDTLREGIFMDILTTVDYFPFLTNRGSKTDADSSSTRFLVEAVPVQERKTSLGVASSWDCYLLVLPSHPTSSFDYTMSQDPSTSTSSTNFDTIFSAALKLKSCDSSSAIIAILRTQVQTFDETQGADERWTKWLDPTVNVLFAFSATLGNVVGVVFPPANAIFTGIGVLLQ